MIAKHHYVQIVIKKYVIKYIENIKKYAKKETHHEVKNDGKYFMTSKYNVITFSKKYVYHQQYGNHIMISKECNDTIKHVYLLC